MNDDQAEPRVIDAELMSSSAVEAMERAAIDVQVATAKKYPRTLSAVKREMLDFATLDKETAESCFYSVPRGGKPIVGPSVRLAEIALSCFRNLRAGSRIVEVITGGAAPHVTIQAFCFDLQQNVAVTIEKRRRITGKLKNNGVPDEDDVTLAANATSAIALRDAIFKVIPGALIKPVFEAARQVAVGDARTLAENRSKAFEALGKMGLTEARVLAALSKPKLEDVGLEDLETLLGYRTAIKDGQAKIDEVFPELGPDGKPKGESKPPVIPERKKEEMPTPEQHFARVAEQSGRTVEELLNLCVKHGHAGEDCPTWETLIADPDPQAAELVVHLSRIAADVVNKEPAVKKARK